MKGQSWAQSKAKAFLPNVSGCSIVKDTTRHRRWVVKYPKPTPPHSASIDIRESGVRSSGVGLSWAWDLYQVATGHQCNRVGGGGARMLVQGSSRTHEVLRTRHNSHKPLLHSASFASLSEPFDAPHLARLATPVGEQRGHLRAPRKSLCGFPASSIGAHVCARVWVARVSRRVVWDSGCWESDGHPDQVYARLAASALAGIIGAPFVASGASGWPLSEFIFMGTPQGQRHDRVRGCARVSKSFVLRGRRLLVSWVGRSL